MCRQCQTDLSAMIERHRGALAIIGAAAMLMFPFIWIMLQAWIGDGCSVLDPYAIGTRLLCD